MSHSSNKVPEENIQSLITWCKHGYVHMFWSVWRICANFTPSCSKNKMNSLTRFRKQQIFMLSSLLPVQEVTSWRQKCRRSPSQRTSLYSRVRLIPRSAATHTHTHTCSSFQAGFMQIDTWTSTKHGETNMSTHKYINCLVTTVWHA